MCTIIEVNGNEYESIKGLSTDFDPIMIDGVAVYCNDIVDDECLCNCDLSATAVHHGLIFEWGKDIGDHGCYGSFVNKK